MTRSGIPNRGASPPRSALIARPGGPMSTTRRMVRLAPLTASRWLRSVARKSSTSPGGTREVSPMTRPGTRARASAERSSVASRSPERSRPAAFCASVGGCRVVGGSRTWRTAANRSPGRAGGASSAFAETRAEGRSDSQRPVPRPWTITSTGLRTLVVLPSAVTRSAVASTITSGGPWLAPRTCGRWLRGSPVTVNSTLARPCSRPIPGSGPRCRSAEWQEVITTEADAQSRAAAAIRGSPRLRTPSRTSASTSEAAAPASAHPAGASRASAAASHAAPAGGTSRRSSGSPAVAGSAAVPVAAVMA